MRQSAAEALGEIGSAEALPQLIPLLKDPDPAVRRSAVRALREISRKEGIRILLDGSWVRVKAD